ncbi:hypothetical protein DNTS_008803, partial [Danionella cerebrum]
ISQDAISCGRGGLVVSLNGTLWRCGLKVAVTMIISSVLEPLTMCPLHGFCYQDTNDIKQTVTAITELGSPLEMIQLLQTPWEERFRICLSLMRLLHYLSHSPLGSVTLLDFRPRQFVLVEGVLKVTDLDDASVEETPCSSSSDCLMEFPARNFTLPCINARCQGMNEKRNLYNAYRFFFTYLLPHSAPSALRPLLDQIVNSTGELIWGADESLAHLEEVLEIYRNGHYLRNNTSTQRASDVYKLSYLSTTLTIKDPPQLHRNDLFMGIVKVAAEAQTTSHLVILAKSSSILRLNP